MKKKTTKKRTGARAARTSTSRPAAKKAAPRKGSVSGRATVAEALAWLEQRGSKKGLADQERYGIVAPKAFGVGVGEVKAYGKTLGTDHGLAQDLWKSGWYEARLLAAFVDDPAQVTAKQMGAWARDFDTWAVVDTVCFHLFDRAPGAWKRIPAWARAKPEFERRAAFALLWSLSVHDKAAPDKSFLACLPLIEKAARDEREYVKKGVDMALRAVGKRNAALNAACVATAKRLAKESDPTARWVGSHALRELESPAVRKRLAGRR